MFGELIGAALADCWKRAGAPADAIYVELGPGRGTLAADALRVMRAAGFCGRSPFRRDQPGAARAAEAGRSGRALARQHRRTSRRRRLLLVANEFLDALPIRQHVGGIERRVLVAAGGLAFDRDGEIVETSPARDEAVAVDRDLPRGERRRRADHRLWPRAHARRRHAAGGARPRLRAGARQPGRAGSDRPCRFRSGRALPRAMQAPRCTPSVTQGEWLIRLGIEARAQALSRANPERAGEIEAALDRLTARDQMGELFKVIALHRPTGRRRRASHDRHLSRRDAADRRSARPHLRHELLRHLRAISIGRRISTPSSSSFGSPKLGGAASPTPPIAFRIAEADGEPVGYREARRRRSFPVETSSPALAASTSSTSSRPCHGAGHRRTQLMDWALDEARAPRRAGALPHRLRRQSPRPALLRPLWLRGGRPLRLHGRQPRRRGHHHAEASL